MIGFNMHVVKSHSSIFVSKQNILLKFKFNLKLYLYPAVLEW